MHRQLIYDVGMHQGEDTDFYLKKGFDVVGIEAHRGFCEACAQRFAPAIAAGRLHLVNKAIGRTAGTVDFFVNDHQSAWGTTRLDWVRRNERRGTRSHAVKVEAVTLAQVLAEFGVPYYLKIDIEGADNDCLEGLRGATERPAYVSVESSGVSLRATRAQLSLLQELGYSRFKIVQQRDVPDQRCPQPAREGVFVEHRFERGASGLFGEEAPGDWLTLAAATAQFRRIHRASRIVGPNYGLLRGVRSERLQRWLRRALPQGLGWYDIHAAS